MNLNQVTLPAIDMAASTIFFRMMGFTQIVDTDHYTRFECPIGEGTFSIHQVSEVASDTGTVVYFEIEKLDEKVHELQAKGLTFFHPPTDERWLWREARLKDPSGNVICLFWGGENRKNPPWRVRLT